MKDITYFGPSDCPEILLQCADVFCMPSYREGFGTSVLEASVLGLPVICSDTYGLRDTIIPGKTGLVHAVGDIEELYFQMEILLLNKSLRTILGQNGLKYVKANFNADDISIEWLKFYKTIL
jgi:glycosyltransferase involved in cell wall biosynthesis